MIPMSVRLRGFMSYREPQELCFDDDRLWVLEGPNGVGKSTIFDAITFALFGHHRLGKQHHQDLINHDSDGMEVELVLRIGEETFKFARTVPRKGSSTCQIWKCAADGRFVPVTGTEQREPYHAWVEEHLGLDYEAFTSSVLLLQGESEKLIQSAPEGRRKVLAQLIDLSRYERLHERAKKRGDEHRKEAARLQQRLGALREIQKGDIDAAAAALDATEKARDALDHEMEQLCELLPAAGRWEQLLAEQADVSLRKASDQEILAQAAEIRARNAELVALAPILEPLRDAGNARLALVGANAAAAAEEALAVETEAEERAAATAGDSARVRVEDLEKGEEGARLRVEDLGHERERLLPVQEKWNAAEEMRRQQRERAAELAALPPASEEAAKQARDTARAAFKDRQSQESQVRAEHAHVVARLRELDQLTGNMEGKTVTCNLCGQEVTAMHAETERARLTKDRDRFASVLAKAAQSLADAELASSGAQHAHEAALTQAQRRRALEEQQEQGALALARQMEWLTEEEARKAACRLADLGPLLAEEKQALARQKQALGEARQEAPHAAERRRRADEARRTHGRRLDAARATQQQALGKLDALLGRLPENLREAPPEEVEATEARVAALRPYGELMVRLQEAEADEAGRRLVEIARQLDEVPVAARREVAELTRARDEKRAAREEAKVRRDGQAVELTRLRADRSARAEAEAARADAAREEHLYGLLSDLLGPEELQRRLVRDAEQAIVELANQELTGLTQGRLRLALRAGKDGDDAAQKALDLLVHNQETGGDRPTALALASGSQKFRIAISLALAIGRYLARETRRVESVIIDEGFGCLDRANREDAVAVLRELSGHLSRVILVSHQEDFSGRFKSGYRIDLVDRTSVPTRVSR
jgi:exonuclease SbcC